MLQKALKAKTTPLAAENEANKILNPLNNVSLEQESKDSIENLQSQPKAKKTSKKAKKKAEGSELISEDSKKTKNKAPKNATQDKKLESSPAQVESKYTKQETRQEIQTQMLTDAKSAELKSFEEALKLDEPSIEELQKHTSKPQANASQKPNALAQSIAALESGALKGKSKSGDKKDSEKNPKRDTQSKESNKIDSQNPSQTSKIQDTQLEESPLFNEQSQIQEEEKSFAEMLLAGGKKKTKTKETEAVEESKGKTQSKQSAEVLSAKENSRTQILYRSALARESVRNFAQALREEVLNYKPPITKLSLELNPQNLGTLELTITKKGKDLHIQVVSNATAVGLFLQNQVDFKNNLAQVGFENVDLNFSSNDGSSGNKGHNGGDNTPQEQREEGNKNSLEDSQNEMQKGLNVMNITLPKYA
ncbi:flagellar hook-length control protein FliK [Helicobacter labetoulli]|uniref:flagellar hook-length control protein FliK n=1 Tax=Helicobacter labetoulli TaxID=2315333 RepID=UPI000EF6C907|nr:flagellar hook-length control protein FliK [Helicobacter labetoulli]